MGSRQNLEKDANEDNPGEAGKKIMFSGGSRVSTTS
jgi:hypothetical protein